MDQRGLGMDVPFGKNVRKSSQTSRQLTTCAGCRGRLLTVSRSGRTSLHFSRKEHPYPSLFGPWSLAQHTRTKKRLRMRLALKGWGGTVEAMEFVYQKFKRKIDLTLYLL